MSIDFMEPETVPEGMAYGLPPCIRCLALFEQGTTEPCPRAPDGGPHEGYLGSEVRQGFSLHVSTCPRSNRSPLLPLTVKCRCGVSEVTDGE